MKGYAFLDVDARIQYRTKDYIDNDNPYFWQQNKHNVMKTWQFDTDDLDSMFNMFKQIRDIFRTSKYGTQTVKDFCVMIDFDMKQLKFKDDNQVQSDQD